MVLAQAHRWWSNPTLLAVVLSACRNTAYCRALKGWTRWRASTSSARMLTATASRRIVHFVRVSTRTSIALLLDQCRLSIKLLPKGLTERKYVDAYMQTLSVQPGAPAIVRDAIGQRLVVGGELFKDATGKLKVIKRGREQCMRLLARALVKPDEICAWLEWEHSPAKAVVRRRYMGRFAVVGRDAGPGHVRAGRRRVERHHNFPGCDPFQGRVAHRLAAVPAPGGVSGRQKQRSQLRATGWLPSGQGSVGRAQPSYLMYGRFWRPWWNPDGIQGRLLSSDGDARPRSVAAWQRHHEPHRRVPAFVHATPLKKPNRPRRYGMAVLESALRRAKEIQPRQDPDPARLPAQRHPPPGDRRHLARVGGNWAYAAIHQWDGTHDMTARQATVRFKTEAGPKLFASRKAKGVTERQVSMGKHQVTMPARPYLGFSQTDDQKIRVIILDWVAERAGGGT